MTAVQRLRTQQGARQVKVVIQTWRTAGCRLHTVWGLRPLWTN